MSHTTTQQNGTTKTIEPLAKGEPDWLARQRREAWQRYQDLPELLPGEKPIHFGHYARKFQTVELGEVQRPPKPGKAASPEFRAAWGECAGEILCQNGYPGPPQLPAKLKAAGVILDSLKKALRKHPDLVEQYLQPAAGEQMAALNTAAWQDGLFLYVPAGLEIALPFYWLNTLLTDRALVIPRSLVVLGRSAKVNLVLDHHSRRQAHTSLCNEGVDLHLGDGASLTSIHMQHWGANVQFRSLVRAWLGRDASWTTLAVESGGRDHISRVQAYLENPGSSATLLGLTIGQAQQNYRQNTLQQHTAPHTSSQLLYHTVLQDEAYAFFNGTISITKAAQQTTSNQQNKNLLLSSGARADAIPNLEILADDIACSHGAAVGALDKEQLFYLMSRGFDKASAQQAIVAGFMEAVVTRLPSEDLQERVRKAMTRLHMRKAKK